MDEALRLFLGFTAPTDRSETILLDDADNRILCKDIIAPMDYPHYDQCILDGYAVKAEDTSGCTRKRGKELLLATKDKVRRGSCVLVHTGSALTPGADALVPIEDTIEKGSNILVLKEVKKREWIWSKGEGISTGNVVFRKGMQLKPTDIAMLAKLGVSHVDVYEKPRVLIVPTGDECVQRGESPGPGFVYETNGLMSSILVKRYGGNPTLHDIVPDDKARLAEAMKEGFEYDLIVTIGGSSAGKRDLMAQVVSSIGKVLYHGVALHPGNHMGAGFIRFGHETRPIAFLPGYTESCAVSTFMFIDPAIRKIGHYPPSQWEKEPVKLNGKISIPIDIIAVRKVNIKNGIAKPVKMLGESAEMGRYAYVIVPDGVSTVESGEATESEYLE